MATVLQLALPTALHQPPASETVELVAPAGEQAGVNTADESTDWNPVLVILAIVLVVAGVAGGILGFRSTSRKQETLEDRDPVRHPDDGP